MPSGRPYIGNLTAAIEANLCRSFSLDDLAATVPCSKTMLHAVFTDAGITFSAVQRELRVAYVIRSLRSGRVTTATGAAGLVVLSESQLCRILKTEVGMTTQDVIRACKLHNRVLRWRKQEEPPAGSRRYRMRRKAWNDAEDELRSLFAHVDDDHRLAAWAQEARTVAKRPDFRFKGPRADQARRRAERLERQAARRTSITLNASTA